MGNKTKALGEMLTMVKGLKESVQKMKEGQTATLTKEQIDSQVTEILSKREKIIKDQMIEDFRKGEFSGEADENVKPQDLLIKKSADVKVVAQQQLNDDIYVLSKIMKVHPTQTKLWKQNQSQIGELRKALNATTGSEGLNWVPTMFSADLIDKFRLALKVGGLFRRVNMPSNPFKWPIVGGDATGYLISEATADSATKITASQMTTNNTVLTAKKIAARTLFSEELAEDSIIPILPATKDNLAITMATTFEKAILNGDTAASHMDTNVTSSSDAQKAFDGLRKTAKTVAQTVDLGTFSTANLRTIRQKMGKYGVDPSKLVWITGPLGYAKFLGLAEVITVDKYGQFATVLTGEIGKFDGVPIIVSEYIYENLNATGYYDGTTTTKTAVVLAYLPTFVIGDRRLMTLKTFEDIQTDQTVLVTTLRAAFTSLYDATTEKVANFGYNIA